MPFARDMLLARWLIGRTALKEVLCYPADVVIEFVSYPIAFIGYFYFVAAIFAHGGGFGGYSLSGLITYFSIGWVLRMIFDQNVEDHLGGEVQSGDVALALVRPMPLASYYFARFVALGLARLVYYGVPAWLLLTLLFRDQIEIEPTRVAWFVPYALVAFRLAFEIQYGLGVLAFFVIVNRQISWSLDMLARLASGLIVPLHLFPHTVAYGLEWLPFSHLYYKPIQALLQPAPPATLLGGLAVGLAWVAVLHLANRRLLALALCRHAIAGS